MTPPKTPQTKIPENDNSVQTDNVGEEEGAG